MPIAGKLERLAAAGIRLLPVPDIQTHYVFERDGLAALVERNAAGFGATGSAGLLTEQGLAALIWRAGRPFFVRKDFEQPASAEQVRKLREFSSDLKRALE